MLKGALGFVHLGRGDPGIQAQQSLPKIPGKQYFLVALAPKGAVCPKDFPVIGKSHLPAQFIPKQMPGTLLNEDVFGIIVAHRINSIFDVGQPNAATALLHQVNHFRKLNEFLMIIAHRCIYITLRMLKDYRSFSMHPAPSKH